jgi:hypothetical protein
MQSPETGARTIFIDAFHIPVTLTRPRGSTDNFGQEGLGCFIAMEQAIFSTFFVIENELNGDLCTIRPMDSRQSLTIAKHVSGITRHDAPLNRELGSVHFHSIAKQSTYIFNKS